MVAALVGYNFIVVSKKKKSCPATCHGGTCGERRYSSHSYLTSALDGGEWSASRPGRALPPGKGPPVPTGQEAGWAPEPVWTKRLEEKSSASVADRIRHYTDCATPAPCFYIHIIKFKAETRINWSTDHFKQFQLLCASVVMMFWKESQ
jgi:hypothetical protein